MNPDQQPGVGPTHFGRRDFGPMMFDSHHDGGASWHWIVPLLFLLVLTAMVAWVLLQSRRTRAAVAVAPGGAPAVDPALEELRLRYARGEVGREEFVATEADLRRLPVAPPPPEPPAAPPAAA
jgi:putative membrane protein